MLVKLRADVKEVKQQVDQNTTILQSLCSTDDGREFEIPDGLDLPMSSDGHIRIMEESLKDGPFRKRLVSAC